MARNRTADTRVDDVARILAKLADDLRAYPDAAESQLGLTPTADVVRRWIPQLVQQGYLVAGKTVPIANVPHLLDCMMIRHHGTCGRVISAAARNVEAVIGR